MVIELLSKPDLRQWALENRRALSGNHILRMSERIADNLKKVKEFVVNSCVIF